MHLFTGKDFNLLSPGWHVQSLHLIIALVGPQSAWLGLNQDGKSSSRPESRWVQTLLQLLLH